MPKSKSTPYSGDLAKRRPKRPVKRPVDQLNGLFGIGERAFNASDALNLYLLAVHYGVQIHYGGEPDWRELALSMAREHVPAFRVEPRGRDQKWSELDEAKLYVEVRGLVVQKGISMRAACIEIAKRPKHRNIQFGSLYDRVRKAKKNNPIIKRLMEERGMAIARVLLREE